MSGAHLHGFVPGPTLQVCSVNKSLAMSGRFDRRDLDPIPPAP